MLRTHPSEPRTSRTQCTAANTLSIKAPCLHANSIAWLLMGDVRSLLQSDVEEVETVDWLRTTLTGLVPVLQRIQDGQFEIGIMSDILHANSDSPDATTKRFNTFRTLVDTLDELLIRLEWNLSVSELIPFADLRLAHWMAGIRDVARDDFAG